MIDTRKNNKWAVYIHIIPKGLSGYDNDKYYVGITGQKPKKRWQRGLGYQKNNPYFYNAINKYGWDNIEHEIVAQHLTQQEAKNMERTLIKELKSNNKEYGYNLTSGGEGSCGLIGNKSNRHRIVYQFDLLGNFIKEYYSIVEAIREMTQDVSATGNSSIEKSIKSVSNGKCNRTYAGFLWSDTLDINIKYTPQKSKAPISLKTNDNKVYYYKNIYDLADKLSLSVSSLRKSLERKYCKYGEISYYDYYKYYTEINDTSKDLSFII